MHNAPKPRIEDLPTTAQLRRSSVIAAIGAVAIGVTVYLPAEHGQDPTGVGTLLGLTEKGEIKRQLAEEAAADALTHGDTDESSSLMDTIRGLFVSEAHAQDATAAKDATAAQEWRDEVSFTLAPGESHEIKGTLEKGGALLYEWTTDGGRINFDLHAHGGGESIDYEKGRGKTEGSGEIEAPFAGDHGWFWRNRDKKPVTVTLKLSGDYSEIVRSG